MDRKVAKKHGGASKKKGADIVSSAAQGAVASATGSGGTPTSFKSGRRPSRLKTPGRRSDAVAVATPAYLMTKVDTETLKKMKGVKMEYEQGRQQQSTVTPMEETSPLPLSSDETPTVSSLDEDDDGEGFPSSKAILLDVMSSPPVLKKRKSQVQSAAAAIKKKALKHARKVMVKPPLSPLAVPLHSDLLEDPLPEKIACEDRDAFKDIVAGIVSKEKAEKQLSESQNKFQELFSETEALKRKEEELLTELKELKKAAETSAVAKRDLEQMVEASKAELERVKLVSSTELQKIRSEVEEKNKSMEEIEMRNAALKKLMEETEKQIAETMTSNQEEIKRLRHDFEVTKAKEMSHLERENALHQTTITKLKDEFSKNLQEKERTFKMLQEDFIVNKNRADDETAEKRSHLKALEAKNKHLEKELVQLRSAKEEYETSMNTMATSSDMKIMALQSQLEAQFRERVEINNKELREVFTREKEALHKEIEEIAKAKIVADKIAEEAQKESERFKAMADKLAADAEKERIAAEKKDNELQKIQKQAKEESERLTRENLNLIQRVEDVNRQPESLQKEKEDVMAVERYDTAGAVLDNRFYNDVLSEIADNAAGVVQNKVMEQNRLLVEDVAQSIYELKTDISSCNQDLVSQQDSRMAEAVRRFTDLLSHSISRGDEIQDSAHSMIERISNETAKKQTEISTMIKRLEERIVEEMEHDDSSDTDKITLAWNLIKESLVKKIGTTYVEINNLRMAIKESSVIDDKGYLESAGNAAKRALLLLATNKELKNALAELDIAVTFYHESREVAFSEVVSIDPDVLKVDVKSLGCRRRDEDTKTIRIKMSIASAMFTEIEIILSDIRKIADHLGSFERQSLQKIETNKIITNLEDLTASKLYRELNKFHFYASTIEDTLQFQNTLKQNQSLLTIFLGVIPFLGSKKDNREITEFLTRKGYNIGEDMVNSIDAFFVKMMGSPETTGVSKREGMDVFISTMINTLAIVSNVIQTINNKIEDEKKQTEIGANQLELFKEHLLEEQNNFMKLQRELNQPSIAMEMKGIVEETGTVALSSPSLDFITEGLRQVTNIVKDSEEKHSQDINNLIDLVLRETKAAYKDSLDRLDRRYKVVEGQQLEQFQKRLQAQMEQQQREQESMKELVRDLEDEIGKERNTIQNLQQERTASPPPASSPVLPITFSNSYREQVGSMEKARENSATNLKMDIDSPRETEVARLASKAKGQLINALTSAAEAISSEEKATENGDRKIKMFLKPEKGEFVEVVLSSQDDFPRKIKTQGLKEALPNKASNKAKKASSTSKSNNTLTGKIFLDTLKDKVFPYSSKSALEDKDEEGGPALLHHPEFFRHAFTGNTTSFTEPLSFLEKTESVRNFTRLLEYSLFNDTARGTRSDNDMLSKLIYVVFEHDAKMIKYLSDIIYKFREYASRGSSNSINENQGDLLEAIIATVFSAVMPVISSMVSRIAEAVSKPVHNDVRIRSTYSLLSLIEKFIFCASRRVHTLKNVLEKSGLVNRLSFYAVGANAEKGMTYDVQYDYSLLRMLLELMTINITNLVDTGIRPLKAAVLSLGTFIDVDKTGETDRALIPVEKSVLSKVSGSDMDVPMTISVINYLSAVTEWYVAERHSDDDTATDKESLNKAVVLMDTLLTNYLGTFEELETYSLSKLENQIPSAIVAHVSKIVLPGLNTKIENIIKETKSNDAILVKGASEVGSLGETAANMSLGVSRNYLALPWLEVDFRGGVDDSTLLWVLSGGVHSEEVVRNYQLAVPLYSSFSTRQRSAAPLHVKPIIKIINNTSGSDNVFLNNNKTLEEKGGGRDDRLHVVNLAKNVSCVLEYSTKDRYESIINKMYRDGLVLVKGDAEVPRVFPMQDGKWMDNTRDNRIFTPLSVSRWKMPSASLVYGMLSKKNKDEGKNKKNEEKIVAPSVIEFMGGRAGNVFLEMLTLPSEQPIVSSTDDSIDDTSTNKRLWKTNKDGYTSLDAQSMMARLISDNNKRHRTGSPASVAMVPYRDAANIVVNDHLEVYNNNSSWWIRGIQPSMRKDAAALFAVQEHLYFVLTPIF